MYCVFVIVFASCAPNVSVCVCVRVLSKEITTHVYVCVIPIVLSKRERQSRRFSRERTYTLQKYFPLKNVL